MALTRATDGATRKHEEFTMNDSDADIESIENQKLDQLFEKRHQLKQQIAMLDVDIHRQKMVIKSIENEKNTLYEEVPSMTLRQENARLRGLFALLAHAEGRTFKAVGNMLGVSGQMAKISVTKGLRVLRLDELQGEETDQFTTEPASDPAHTPASDSDRPPHPPSRDTIHAP